MRVGGGRCYLLITIDDTDGGCGGTMTHPHDVMGGGGRRDDDAQVGSLLLLLLLVVMRW